MNALPSDFQSVLDKYISPLDRLNISAGDFGHIMDALEANYAYGIAVGLALASATENKPMLSRFSIGDEGNPIVNEILNAIAPYEAEFAQHFEEEMNL